MIENAVEDNSDTVFVELVAYISEGVIVTETSVDSFIVNSIVSVLNRLKNGTEVNSVNVHFLEVFDPVENLIKTINDFATVVILRRSAEAEGIDVIDNSVVVPIHK